MKTNTKENLILADIKEYAAILVIKVLLAALMFAFSATIVDIFNIYINRADGWIKESSHSVSRNIIDLYR